MKKFVLVLFVLCASLQASSFSDEKQSLPGIAIVTVPKSGSHLIGRLITLLSKELNFESPPGFHTDEFMRSKTLPKTYPKRILLVRDPRDVCLSWINFIKKGVEKDVVDFIDKNILALPEPHKATWRSLNFDTQLAAVIRGESHYTHNLKIHPTLVYYPLVTFEPAIHLAREPQTLICKFENLVGPKGGGTEKAQKEEILKIVQFLGLEISEEQLNQIAPQLFGGVGTFHKGQIGGWRNTFNSSNKKLFKKRKQYLLEAFGYEKDTHW
ncbi:MAG: sulfotransferase domain-containing protein [Simkaniaceae bacterium]